MRSIGKLARVGVGLVAVTLVGVFVLADRSTDPVNNVQVANTELATLDISSMDLEFGDVVIGQQSVRTITVANTSIDDTHDIIIDNLFLDEHDERYYSIDKKTPLRLSSGESTELVITFTPTAIGREPGRLILNHTGKNASVVIDLHGVGLDSDPNAPPMAAAAPGSYPFGKSTLEGFGGGKPTSLQFGPDGKLYVALMDGAIHVLDVARSDENKYKVVGNQVINLVKNIQNHNDEGKKVSVKNRLVTGLVVTGSAAKPVIYVHSSDPRIGGGKSGNTTGLDTNSGVISRLTKNGSGWKKLDIVRGLSRSEENHHGNGLELSANGDKLYLAAGGNTNMGAPSNNFAQLPEYALSAAILEIDLQQIGNKTYDLPTLDDEDRAGSKDANDPFGGNGGKNQAKLVSGGPVQVYAPGFRNPYDVVIMENGLMYSWDNGPNSGWGGEPVKNGPKGNCTNGIKEPGKTQHDALHLITGKGYYAGHPNPTRGNKKNKFNKSNPQSPVPNSNPIECDYRGPGTNGNGKHKLNKSLVSLSNSTNGLAEYTASNFGGDMKGSLLATSWNNKVYRVTFKSSGELNKNEALFSNVGSNPLDVAAQGDNDIFPGTIWVANFQGKNIVVFEPDDYQGGGGSGCFAGNGHGDADGDGFTDADENANETDPCSAADTPADADFDGLSDLTDLDDDNDGIADVVDPFARDESNGAGTEIGLDYQWENDSPPAGFIADLGFSGLMSNSVDDYQSQFDLDEMTIRGAAGVVTIDNIPAGDPINKRNNQEYGFQFGVNVDSASPVFRAHTRILAPLSGFEAKPHQSIGLFIGTGDQDNYIKLTVNATAPTGGLEFSREVNGKRNARQETTDGIFTSTWVDLFIEVDPGSAIASAYYQVTNGEHIGELLEVGGALDFPPQWLENSTKLAVGIISTSTGADPFPATWDFISVKPVDTTGEDSPPQVTLNVSATATAGVALAVSADVTDETQGNDQLTMQWDVESGPGSVEFESTEKQATTVIFSEAGIYQIAFEASNTTFSNRQIAIVTVEEETSSQSTAVYRINAGGSLLEDTSGNWAADNGAGSLANTGKTWNNSASIDLSGIAASLPAGLFKTERYDRAGGPDLKWHLPVDPGQYEVRLYFSENYIGAMAVGGRVFSVQIENQEISDLDIYAQAGGGHVALMKSVIVDADASLDIQFSHQVQNPAINGIEIIKRNSIIDLPLLENAAPVVQAGADITTIAGSTHALVGRFTDDGLPSSATTVLWSKQTGPGDVSFATATDLATTVSFSAAGNYLLALAVSDGELSGEDQITVAVSEAESSSQLVYRINAGGPFVADSSGNWQSDANGSSFVNTGKVWSASASVDTSGLAMDLPEQLFKTERYDRSNGPELKWSLPVEPGKYEVRLFFSENYPGAMANGARVFSVQVEGHSRSNIDVFAQVGGNTAMMESFVVDSNSSLNIGFSHVQENPSIKAIEVLRLDPDTPIDPEILPIVNMAPQVVTNPVEDGLVSVPLQISANVSDDGLPDGVLYALWTKVSGPGDVLFASTTSVTTTAGFSAPGNYVLALSINDGDLTTSETVAVAIKNVPPPESNISYRINAGGPALQDENGDWQADNNNNSYANTGKLWSQQQSVNTDGITGNIPDALFNTERWDNANGPEMQWSLPVSPGDYEVRLYFAETYSGAMLAGARSFDVSVEDQNLQSIDVYAEAGAYNALVKVLTVTSDESLDIVFTHDVQNPSVKAIEVLAL